MLPAARITDPTVHGGVITTGFPTVLIGGKPAARISDMHTCPMVTVLVPHVGGPIIRGSFTVLTGNMPQSRVTDTAICVGPPDMIMMGQPNVLVGDAGGGGLGGLLAGLMMASGNFGGGYPRAVLQEDGTIVTEYNEQISIEGSPEYQATVAHDLNLFAQTEVGDRWAEAFAETGRHVTIRPRRAGTNQDNGGTTRVSPDDALMRPDGSAGDGSDSVITYNPSRRGVYEGEDGGLYDRAPHETLGHELIHGLHNAQGENMRNFPDPDDPDDNQEEARTIGVHGFEDEPISEREMLEEDGRAARPDHDSIEETTYQDENGQWWHRHRDENGRRTRDRIDPPLEDAWRPNH